MDSAHHRTAAATAMEARAPRAGEVAGGIVASCMGRAEICVAHGWWTSWGDRLDAGSLADRGGTDPASLADLVRRTAREAHPALSTPNVRTLAEHVDRSLQQDRLLATLATGFGAVALFLVCLGLYG